MKLFIRAQMVAAELEGTCKSEQEAIEAGIFTEKEFNDPAFMTDLGTHVVRCCECDWWWPVEELNRNDKCPDCDPEGADE